MTNSQSTGGRKRDLALKVNRIVGLSSICLLSSGLLAGCVSSEKYEAEKARALNFQRLLAQEEKRTGTLNSQVQETKRQLASLKSHNEDLKIELDGLQEEANRTSQPNPRSTDSSSPETSLSEFGLDDLSFEDSDLKDFGAVSRGSNKPNYYRVERGDTLWKISREYGVTVRQLKDWNDLVGSVLSIGQRLIVNKP